MGCPRCGSYPLHHMKKFLTEDESLFFMWIVPFSGILLLFQHAVDQYQRQHCLGNRHDTGDDTGIVSAANGNFHDIPVDVPGLLGLCYRGRRLDSDPHDNILTAGDTAKDAPGMIAGKPVFCHRIVVLAPESACSSKPVANLDSLDRPYPHHCTGNLCIEFPKDRIAKPGGAPFGNNLSDTSHRITRLFCLQDLLFDFCRRWFSRARLEFCPGMVIPSARKILQGNGTGSDPADGLAPGTPSSAPVVPDAVLFLVREISMARAEFFAEFFVILRVLVLIADQ